MIKKADGSSVYDNKSMKSKNDINDLLSDFQNKNDNQYEIVLIDQNQKSFMDNKPESYDSLKDNTYITEVKSIDTSSIKDN